MNIKFFMKNGNNSYQNQINLHQWFLTGSP